LSKYLQFKNNRWWAYGKSKVAYDADAVTYQMFSLIEKELAAPMEKRSQVRLVTDGRNGLLGVISSKGILVALDKNQLGLHTSKGPIPIGLKGVTRILVPAHRRKASTLYDADHDTSGLLRVLAEHREEFSLIEAKDFANPA
jgi:hypothetical protein